MLSVVRRDLLLRQSFSGTAVGSRQPNYELRGEARNGTVNGRFGVDTVAELAGQAFGEPCISGLFHLLQCVGNALVRNEVQKRRLLKLHRQSLPQGAVKYW